MTQVITTDVNTILETEGWGDYRTVDDMVMVKPHGSAGPWVPLERVLITMLGKEYPSAFVCLEHGKDRCFAELKVCDLRVEGVSADDAICKLYLKWARSRSGKYMVCTADRLNEMDSMTFRKTVAIALRWRETEPGLWYAPELNKSLLLPQFDVDLLAVIDAVPHGVHWKLCQLSGRYHAEVLMLAGSKAEHERPARALATALVLALNSSRVKLNASI